MATVERELHDALLAEARAVVCFWKDEDRINYCGCGNLEPLEWFRMAFTVQRQVEGLLDLLYETGAEELAEKAIQEAEVALSLNSETNVKRKVERSEADKMLEIARESHENGSCCGDGCHAKRMHDEHGGKRGISRLADICFSLGYKLEDLTKKWSKDG